MIVDTSAGKGRHPAALNFGDCFAYALARALDEPLLFKGKDFSKKGRDRGGHVTAPGPQGSVTVTSVETT